MKFDLLQKHLVNQKTNFHILESMESPVGSLEIKTPLKHAETLKYATYLAILGLNSLNRLLEYSC